MWEGNKRVNLKNRWKSNKGKERKRQEDKEKQRKPYANKETEMYRNSIFTVSGAANAAKYSTLENHTVCQHFQFCLIYC